MADEDAGEKHGRAGVQFVLQSINGQPGPGWKTRSASVADSATSASALPPRKHVAARASALPPGKYVAAKYVAANLFIGLLYAVGYKWIRPVHGLFVRVQQECIRSGICIRPRTRMSVLGQEGRDPHIRGATSSALLTRIFDTVLRY